MANRYRTTRIVTPILGADGFRKEVFIPPPKPLARFKDNPKLGAEKKGSAITSRFRRKRGFRARMAVDNFVEKLLKENGLPITANPVRLPRQQTSQPAALPPTQPAATRTKRTARFFSHVVNQNFSLGLTSPARDKRRRNP